MTEDHVIPQCLFPNGIPSDAPKAWACEPCIGVVKSRLDQYFRDILVTDTHTSLSPIMQQIIPKFLRAVKRNQSMLARDILKEGRQVELRISAGLYGGQAYIVPKLKDKTFEILSMYVQGLYAYYYHKSLSQDVDFDFVRKEIDTDLNDIIRILRDEGGIDSIGDGEIFQCVYGHTSDRPEAGIWILNFVQRGLFVVFVTPKTVDQPDQAPMVS